MRPHYSITTPPTMEAVSYQEAADQLRVDSTADMAYIEALIGVAVEYVENVTGRVGSRATWLCVAPTWATLTQDRTDQTIRLARTPLVSVSSVKYYAPDGVALTTLSTDDYRVITTTEPGMIQPVDDWPDVDDRADAIQIAFIAGQPDGCAAPAGWKHAVKMLVAHLYENRVPIAVGNIVNEIPYGLQALIESQRMEGRFA